MYWEKNIPHQRALSMGKSSNDSLPIPVLDRHLGGVFKGALRTVLLHELFFIRILQSKSKFLLFGNKSHMLLPWYNNTKGISTATINTTSSHMLLPWYNNTIGISTAKTNTTSTKNVVYFVSVNRSFTMSKYKNSI